jgi:hypothetical protein
MFASSVLQKNEGGIVQPLTTILIFSKNRAMQLLALLESLEGTCEDLDFERVQIVYKTTTERHERQYEELKRLYPAISFSPERTIAFDYMDVVRSSWHVMFLTDDSIFLRDFRIAEIEKSLGEHGDCIGFSLRLGRNITYSYPHDCSQDAVEFVEAGNGVLGLNWTLYKCDFGYPMELSGSMYRSSDLLFLSKGMNMSTLHHVESSLDRRVKDVGRDKCGLLCYPISHVFSAPMNLTSAISQNRASNTAEYSVDAMAEKFDEGYKIDVSLFRDFVPSACHQEVTFSWKRR